MIKDRYEELKLAERGAVLSIVTYLFIATLKLIIANYSGSSALRADGLNNTTDTIASIAVLIGLRLARRPPDDNHPYGHWKAETVASMVTSFIMLAVGLEVLISAVKHLFAPERNSPDLIAGYVGLFSSIILMAIYIYNNKLAKKQKSKSLQAASKDTFNDSLISLSTAIAIFASNFNMPWLDSVMAIIVSLIILKTAFEIFRESAFELSDGFNENDLKEFKQTILTLPEVLKVESIKGRTYGTIIHVDVIIKTNPEMTVKRSHELTEQVEQLLADDFGVFDTKVHVEPSE
ncbi:putative cation efflux transporter [Carnobacterium sp. 17-4]|uniref:cation diffusion facilitator family transporter n=1 Tax=Carnobacterium sp. (strain 17-4) TaxID=208596 RepID=UPI0002058702|nr:cation diffusion facilitator family transporter [Carnobacterium sp. 17-4]AEB29961.1 putative cation efflux transporter [Carnobacterium sp. 17-4]